MFGDDIVLQVIGVWGDKVRLGVQHPKRFTIHRRVVYEAILSRKEVGQGT